MQKESVDVIINVFGKTYQKILTLSSIVKYSGAHIDKIDYSKITSIYDNVILDKTKYHIGTADIDIKKLKKKDYRHSLRYQYEKEHTDKKYVFITHNECVYKKDIIDPMIDQIGKR